MSRLVAMVAIVAAAVGAGAACQRQASEEASPAATVASAAPLSASATNEDKTVRQAPATSATSGAPRFGTARCDACLQQNCNPYVGAVPVLANCQDETCEKAFACFQRSRCAQDTATITQCYCGPVDTSTCLADNFVPTGPCRYLVERGLGRTDPRLVVGAFFDSNSTGDGISLFNCAAELCIPECLTDPAIPTTL